MAEKKSRIAQYDPLGLRLDQRFYTDDDIGDVIAAVQPVELPSGLIAVEVLNKDGTKWVKRRFNRRNALALRLETAAHYYAMEAEFQLKPAASELRNALKSIEKAAGRLWDALGLEGKTEFEDMPQALKSELGAQAESHGERIDGYDDMPPTQWPMKGGNYVDYWGRAKLRQAVEDVALLRLWARNAKARAAAQVQTNGQRRTTRHSGDKALNDWFGNLAGIWLDVYERLPATSVGATGRANEGIGGGPFVRFIKAALQPVLGKSTPDDEAIRSRAKRLFPSVKSKSKKS